jgi:hypothetical protein
MKNNRMEKNKIIKKKIVKQAKMNIFEYLFLCFFIF